jgi:ABC-type amino acid transport substrate-binding protein
MAEEMATRHGKVVVNLGGTGEVANAINVNPLAAQQVKDVPNLVRDGAEDVGSLFKAGTVDNVVANDIVAGTVNWSKAAGGSFRILKSGGQVSIAPYAGGLAPHLAEIQSALRAAGFKEVRVELGRLVTAVKP